jgi:hypothetical protein
MRTSRSRSFVLTLVAGTLSLLGAAGALAAVPAKGISPTCLLVPQAHGCEGGIIS